MKKNILIIIFIGILFFPALTSAEICPNSQGDTVLCNPTKVGSIAEFGYFVATGFGVIIGWQVIAMVMFAGFRMIMAQGNSEEITKAKSALQWSISGFVLAIFSYLIVAGIAKYLSARPDYSQGSAPEGLNPLTHGTFGALFKSMIQGLLGLAGLLAIHMIIISGYKYITAQGNQEQTEQAKEGLYWAVAGLIVILLAYVIVTATAKLFITVTR